MTDRHRGVDQGTIVVAGTLVLNPKVVPVSLLVRSHIPNIDTPNRIVDGFRALGISIDGSPGMVDQFELEGRPLVTTLKARRLPDISETSHFQLSHLVVAGAWSLHVDHVVMTGRDGAGTVRHLIVNQLVCGHSGSHLKKPVSIALWNGKATVDRHRSVNPAKGPILREFDIPTHPSSSPTVSRTT